jgi:hypothetical protein
LAQARQALEQATWSLPFPEGVEAIGVTLRVGAAAGATDSVEVAYLAPGPLEPQAADVLAGVLRRAVGHAALRTSFHRAGPAVVALQPADTAGVAAVVALVQRYPGLEVRVRSAPPDSLAAAAVLRALRAAGAAPVAVEPLNESGTIEVRVRRPPR